MTEKLQFDTENGSFCKEERERASEPIEKTFFTALGLLLVTFEQVFIQFDKKYQSLRLINC